MSPAALILLKLFPDYGLFIPFYVFHPCRIELFPGFPHARYLITNISNRILRCKPAAVSGFGHHHLYFVTVYMLCNASCIPVDNPVYPQVPMIQPPIFAGTHPCVQHAKKLPETKFLSPDFRTCLAMDFRYGIHTPPSPT